jgi:hypothetical protein
VQLPKNRAAATTTDAAGRRVPLWTPWCAQKETVPSNLRERIGAALDARRHDGEALVWGCGYMLAGLIAAVTIGRLAREPWLPGVVILMVVVGMALVQRHTAVRRSRENIRSTLLSAGCCASCGYDLRGAQCDSRGLTCCPECGAMWVLSDASSEGPGDRPEWARGPVGRLMEDMGLGFLLKRGSHSGIDGRGRVVEFVFPVPARRPPSHWHLIPDDDRYELERKLWALDSVFRTLMVGGTAALVLGSLLIASWSIGAGGAPRSLFLHAFWPLFFIALTIARLRYPVVLDKGRISSVMLSYGRCPSCAGSLSQSPPDREGITDCPHCRAAWRVPEMKPRAVRDPQRTIVYAPPRD